MHTTAGSLALLGSKPLGDARLVARLKQAGAVILGKANLSEWANFRGSPSSSGWSGRGGQCRNPHVLNHTPSGSSAGCGAAVAASGSNPNPHTLSLSPSPSPTLTLTLTLTL